MKIAVIGAGISGLSIGRMLHDKGIDVTIFEQTDKVGGIAKCELINGTWYHNTGGHIFNTKHEEVSQWFWSIFDKKDFLHHVRDAKILLDGSWVGYPIENYLYQLPEVYVRVIVAELTMAMNLQFAYPESVGELLRNRFGDTLYDLYFHPYNEKIWGVSPGTLDIVNLEGKIPSPNHLDVLVNNVMRKAETNVVHSQFYYPRYGGSQFICDKLAEGLRIVYLTKITDFVQSNGRYEIQDEVFDAIVYTGRIDQLVDMELEYHGTTSCFCLADKPFDFTWAYIPDKNIKIHRIINIGKLSWLNSECACIVEFTGEVTYEIIRKELEKLPGNIKLIKYHYESCSYVINDQHTMKYIADIKRQLATKNLFLCGRFAEWRYYNMDDCMQSAFDVVSKICI